MSAPPPPAHRPDGSLATPTGGVHLVTGAFGNTGSAIARILVEQGRAVRTLTGRTPPPDGGAIDARPFAWDDPGAMVAAFDGVTTFVNTYWMRTGDASGGYDLAVDRCTQLIDAAERAGVERIVHISVAHPHLESPYPYFRGKARVEQRLRESPVPAAVVRPTLVFGGDSVLLNNLAFLLRRFPAFAVAGDGRYRVRPVHVDDIARICVAAGDRVAVEVIDAVGPDRPTYLELVRQVRQAVGGRARIFRAPTPVVLAASRVLGAALRDDLVDRDELVSTIEGLADTDGPSTGAVSLSTWLTEHGATLGRSYVNERANRR